MKRIREQLAVRKREIVDAWAACALEAYPPKSRGFYAREKNRFANPIGEILDTGLSRFIDTLVEGGDALALCAHLDGIIQVRSVQALKPSEALSFLFQLKQVIRGHLQRDSADADLSKALEVLDGIIDATALNAFDRYLKYRERVFDVRVSDIRRQVSSLLKRTAFFDDAKEGE